MRNQRIAGVILALIGVALLYAGLSGAVDDLMPHDCGAAAYRPDCAPDEASGVLRLVGGIFLGAAALLILLSYALRGRITDPLTTSIDPASIPVWNAPAAPAPIAPSRTLAESLTRLAALRDRGAITEAEFQAQKARLLD